MKYKVNQREVLRYLGYSAKDVPETQVLDVVEECIEMIDQVVEVKTAWNLFSLQVAGDICLVSSEQGVEMKIQSKNLSTNLKDCSKVIMMAVTLGLGVDRLIRRLESLQVSKAAICQAVAADYVEQACDDLNEQIRKEAEKKGFGLRPRYSPGYGDVDLCVQRDFSRILSMQKNMGITLTENFFMMPSKSVTAFIGAYKLER